MCKPLVWANQNKYDSVLDERNGRMRRQRKIDLFSRMIYLTEGRTPGAVYICVLFTHTLLARSRQRRTFSHDHKPIALAPAG